MPRRVWLILPAGMAGLLWLGVLTLQGSVMAAIDPTTLPVTSDTAKRLREHVELLASPKLQGRKPGTPGHREAAAYIAERFRQAGLEPLSSLKGYEQALPGELGASLIGVRPAPNASARSRWILVGAHYDHLGKRGMNLYLGADDNASSVAILLELARVLPAAADHPILFVAFNAEEAPYIGTKLMGSQYFLDHLPAEIASPADFHAVIIMDLMGGAHWQPTQETIFAIGAEKSPELYRRVRDAATGAQRSALSVLLAGIHLLEEVPLIGHHPFSDYDAFRNASVPFLFLSAGRTPRYHQPSDLPDTLHYERMAKSVGWLRKLVESIDQDKEPYRFEPDRLEVQDEIETLRALVAQASQWDTRIPGTSPLSLARLKMDKQWLERLDLNGARQGDDWKAVVRQLERISIRLQCLMVDFYGCAFF